MVINIYLLEPKIRTSPGCANTTLCSAIYTKLRFLQEYDFTDNHELDWCPVFVSHSLQPMLNDLQREPWPVNHLPAGNVPVVGFEPTYRRDQYEQFVKADRFYRPLPLHWQEVRLTIHPLKYIFYFGT